MGGIDWNRFGKFQGFFPDYFQQCRIGRKLNGLCSFSDPMNGFSPDFLGGDIYYSDLGADRRQKVQATFQTWPLNYPG
jgi:hypothetical protein